MSTPFVTQTGKPFVFIESRTTPTKNNPAKTVTFAKVADPTTYESYDFLIDSELPKLAQGDLIDIQLLLNQYQGKTSVKANLYPVKAV